MRIDRGDTTGVHTWHTQRALHSPGAAAEEPAPALATELAPAPAAGLAGEGAAAVAARAASYAVLNAPATSASLNLIANVVCFSSSSEKSSAVYTQMLSLSERDCCNETGHKRRNNT